MKYSTQVKPISYLKNHMAEIVNDISTFRQPLLITQNGEIKLAIIDIKSFEEQEETLAALKLLAIGNKAIEKGEGRGVDDVLMDFDKL